MCFIAGAAGGWVCSSSSCPTLTTLSLSLFRIHRGLRDGVELGLIWLGPILLEMIWLSLCFPNMVRNNLMLA